VPLEQGLPSATQSRPLVSQQPEAQLLPGQHAWPGPPQTAQVFPEQIVFAAVHELLEQHG
jgi:hypothetical protein